ncbi:hypothetical protein BpHYR1_000428 [Brachionus plicatilis]|uniref:Uncharacterized protein n=1 Tax=Brachionus plicatilis TaxID=10195 RepID=A0A3M7PPR2_BRAPC|nr:hypothetical protein BpHYR1_000428 [Brachionus plicatilis]
MAEDLILHGLDKIVTNKRLGLVLNGFSTVCLTSYLKKYASFGILIATKNLVDKYLFFLNVHFLNRVRKISLLSTTIDTVDTYLSTESLFSFIIGVVLDY